MAFLILPVANFFSIPSSHPSQEKLLAHKARNNGLCIGNTENPTYCQVIKGKDNHPDRLHSYTQYTQPVFNNLYNPNDANESLFSMRLTISSTIPSCCLTQARKKTYFAWRLELSSKRQYKSTLLKSSLLQVGCFLCIQCHTSSYK